MHYYESSTTIDASPDAIWVVLTDAEHYPDWDSGIQSVEGHIAPDATITVHAAINPGRAFPVKVSQFMPSESMTWTGGMPMGLFTGVRTFRLEPIGEQQTRFTMREEYHGPLVPMMWRSMPDLHESFDQFTNGLKTRVESEVRS